jgi:hypothetical protein
VFSAGVTDASFACQGVVHQQILKVDQFADSAAAVQITRVYGRDTCAVIPTVFQPFEGFDKDRGCFVMSQDADNSTHFQDSFGAWAFLIL